MVVQMSMVNTVVLLLDLAVTATVIGYTRQSLGKDRNKIEEKRQGAEAESRQGQAQRCEVVWVTGVGTLLWELEGRLSRPTR